MRERASNRSSWPVALSVLLVALAGIALVGAGLMVASGALLLDDAYKAVDLDTITLLLGVMIVVASLRLSGFFAVANAWVMAHARRPLILLGAAVATSGVFSSFLVNDAICLVLAPLVLELTLAGAPACGLPAGRGHGVECRVDRHHHRQSTEHDDRQLLANHLHKQGRDRVAAARCNGRCRATALIANGVSFAQLWAHRRRDAC